MEIPAVEAATGAYQESAAITVSRGSSRFALNESPVRCHVPDDCSNLSVLGTVVYTTICAHFVTDRLLLRSRDPGGHEYCPSTEIPHPVP